MRDPPNHSDKNLRPINARTDHLTHNARVIPRTGVTALQTQPTRNNIPDLCVPLFKKKRKKTMITM